MLLDVAQALVNGIISGVILAIPALGFNAMFAITRYASFAIGSIATVGAYGGWALNHALGTAIYPGLPGAFAAASLAALLVEIIFIRPLRHSGPLIMAIGSLAAGILLENVMRFGFGNDLLSFNVPILRDTEIGFIRVGDQQFKNLALALLVMAGLWLVLKYTDIGHDMRAAAENMQLAQLKGINANFVYLLAIVVGGGLTGVGGMLVGLDLSVDPLTGSRLLISIFAAAVLGGLGSIPGAVVGALIIGLSEELSVLFLSPSYRSAISFLIIFVVLTIRPNGLFGAQVQ